MYEERNRETSPPPVLLPGSLCDARLWEAQKSALRAFDPLILPDYGAARSIRDMALHVLDRAPPVMALAGHAMGARVALEMALISPERIARLALLDTVTEQPTTAEADGRQAMLALGETQGIERLVDEWLASRLGPAARDDAVFVERLTAMCASGGLVRYEAESAALLDRPDVRPLLAGIRCPTLVGVGRHNRLGMLERHEEIAAAIPGAKFVVFENCGHMSPAEAPEQVSAALLRWLEQDHFFNPRHPSGENENDCEESGTIASERRQYRRIPAQPAGGPERLSGCSGRI
ncbi:MAG TPA: alpha/beta fold hydrolase [Sphingomonadaceae bacterium]|nr:alpha/beta fold hydrolase [Sphingomonadaceae bacterium]